MKLKELLKKIGLKDLIFIGLIAILFFMYILRKPKSVSDDKIQAKIDKLEDHITSLEDKVVVYNSQDSLLRDSLNILKTEKINIDAKIKDVYKTLPKNYAIVNSLDVKHLEEFFANREYESK